MRRNLTGLALATALVVAVAGCDGSASAGPAVRASSPAVSAPSASVAPSDSAEPSEAPEGDVVVDRLYYGVNLQVTVHPVEVRDGVAALSIEYATEAGADVSGLPDSMVVLNGAEKPGGSGVRLVDGDQVIPVAAVGDKPAASLDADSWEAGVARKDVALFAAPHGDSVGVLIPELGYVADVPVRAGGALFDDVVATVGQPTAKPAFALRTFFVGTQSTAAVQKKTVTVTLRSDVLFASSQYQLSAGAVAALKDAAAQIRAGAPGGKVTVVGHTDDVDTDAVNQKLSEQRAASVASELGSLLGGKYSITAEGRGESEPVAAGTSDAARQANRRVEISFEGKLTATTKTGTPTKLPGNDAPMSSGLEPVHYVSKTVGTKFTAQVVEVVRTGTGLVGTLKVTSDPADATPADMLGDSMGGFGLDRGFDLSNLVAGAHELSLLLPGKRVMPFDYEVPKGAAALKAGRRLLGDEALPFPTGPGELVTVVWPDTGQDKVTIDVPHWFRIADVPVTDAGAAAPKS